MGFYGNIKRAPSSPWIFDRYFSSRKIMDDGITKDNVYIGRYVLVSYCQVPPPDPEDENYNENYNENYTPNFIDRYIGVDSEGNKQEHSVYQANRNLDSNFYNDTYDNTVWQKVYTNLSDQSGYKYILIARLNALPPHIKVNPIPPKIIDKTTGKEEWNKPSVSLITTDTYNINMPETLKLDVGNIDDDFYGRELVSNIKYKVQKDGLDRNAMLSPQYNKMEWTNYKSNDEEATQLGDEIVRKELNVKLYAFGQIMSDIYDVIYGNPGDSGVRPFYVDNLSDLLSHYDKGLAGILASVASDQKGDVSLDSMGRSYQPGMYYYFNTRWTDAQESPDNFIQNIPKVVGSLQEFNSGKAHYVIDFKDGLVLTHTNSDNDRTSENINSGPGVNSGTITMPGIGDTGFVSPI